MEIEVPKLLFKCSITNNFEFPVSYNPLESSIHDSSQVIVMKDGVNIFHGSICRGSSKNDKVYWNVLKPGDSIWNYITFKCEEGHWEILSPESGSRSNIFSLKPTIESVTERTLVPKGSFNYEFSAHSTARQIFFEETILEFSL